MSAKQVVEALGGSGYLGSKPGLAGFWDRVSTRQPAAEQKRPAPVSAPALAAPHADTPPDTVIASEPPGEILQSGSLHPVPAAARGNGSHAATKPAFEAEVFEQEAASLLAASARTTPPAQLGDEPRPRRAPARTFKTTLSLPEPNVPAPPRRPADIFGLTPPSTHSPAPRPGTATPAPRIARAPAKGTEPPSRKKPQQQAEPPAEVAAEESPSGADMPATIAAGGDHATPSHEETAPVALQPDEIAQATDAEESRRHPLPRKSRPPPRHQRPRRRQPLPGGHGHPEAQEAPPPDQPVEVGTEPKARLGQILRKAGKKKTRSKPN